MSKDCHHAKLLGIWAGIVTYNPNIERLRENIDAIHGQVDRLLIFDNGSENVNQIEVHFGGQALLIKSADNLGMAKALNYLAAAALEGGASDIVLLDQDSVADSQLIEMESKLRAADVGLISCLIIDRNVEISDFDSASVFERKRAITSGSMVNLSAWDAVGRYDERLFVDWVDNEFCDNLRFHNYRILKTHATSILHEMGNQEYAWSGPGRDYANNKRRNRGYYRQNYSTWRWRDRSRGQIFTMRKYKWTRIMLDEFLIFFRGTIGRILVLENNKLHCLKAVCAGIGDAFLISISKEGH